MKLIVNTPVNRCGHSCAFCRINLNKKFAIAVFNEDKSVEVVASSWVSTCQTLCWWPSSCKNKEKLMKLICTTAKPDEKKWSQFSIRLLNKTTG